MAQNRHRCPTCNSHVRVPVVEFEAFKPNYRICKYVETQQPCPFGSHCTYFHDQTDQIIVLASEYRTDICHSYPYPGRDMRMQINHAYFCPSWQKTPGQCVRGDECLYLHGANDEIRVCFVLKNSIRIVTHKNYEMIQMNPQNQICPFITAGINCPLNPCKWYHSIKDVITVSVQMGGKLCDDNRPVLLEIKHTESQPPRKNPLNLMIKAKRCSSDKGYCTFGKEYRLAVASDSVINSEECISLHGPDDHLSITYKYNHAPQIIHSRCYSKMPVLPADIWRKIISLLRGNETIWTSWLIRLGHVSKVHQGIIRNFYLGYLKNPVIIPHNNDVWTYDKIIHYAILRFPKMPTGYLYCDETQNPDANFASFSDSYIGTNMSKNFFETEHVRTKFLIAKTMTRISQKSFYGTTFAKESVDWPMRLPVIVIPIPQRQTNQRNAAFVLCPCLRTAGERYEYTRIQTRTSDWLIEVAYDMSSARYDSQYRKIQMPTRIRTPLTNQQVFQIVQFIISPNAKIPISIEELIVVSASYTGRSVYDPSTVVQNDCTDWMASMANL